MSHSSNHVSRSPDANGYYGDFGGNHWPERMRPALEELTGAYEELRASPEFRHELDTVRVGLQGRPTPVHHLENTSNQLGGARIYVKREDLNHTGAHKINHCVGFALLAVKMGKRKLIAETGAGQHGVALASAAARFGLECEVHIGAVDADKVNANVSLMRLLGAQVVPVAAGQSTLKEASDSAMHAYAEQHAHALYGIGSAIGPHPFPMIVRDFQSVVGQEARAQFLSITGGALPDHVVACVAGGSNALGLYSGFLDDPEVALHAVEPLGRSAEPGQHAATLTFGRPGTLHGASSVVLRRDDGGPAAVMSIASGLAYPGVGPEMAMLSKSGRLSVDTVSDEEAVATFLRVARSEGIVPALESAHALAFAIRLAAGRPPTERILVNLSGRGDKDVDFVLTRYDGNESLRG
ncbi:tryptophan synthase subunit beta [Saccharothrix coeruleofusca]|uniref:Tryptophan synthase beta chain n=1 Tax=Saccharothrix coeruleofusca TaxID=33919 RepID=A0A918APH9_9PSEU|nr:tryptophan synthase subunit beta [Saccharothrix coeruleofusca]MBP2334880.1 tryptophan synthase beta chain [Saccharothrix coeruleofusca]GGP67665.1 tryptophan synthase beta chain 2 [Saccharothrix coeruleofusca]